MTEEKIKKKGAGRRSNFEVTEDLLKEVSILSNRGLNQTQIRDYYGISKNSWQRKKKSCPALRQAYAMGKSKGISYAASKLMELIKTGNLEAIKYYLSRVGKYTEAPECEEDEDEKPKNIRLFALETTDPVEAAKIYQQFMQGSSKNE